MRLRQVACWPSFGGFTPCRFSPYPRERSPAGTSVAVSYGTSRSAHSGADGGFHRSCHAAPGQPLPQYCCPPSLPPPQAGVLRAAERRRAPPFGAAGAGARFSTLSPRPERHRSTAPAGGQLPAAQERSPLHLTPSTAGRGQHGRCASSSSMHVRARVNNAISRDLRAASEPWQPHTS